MKSIVGFLSSKDSLFRLSRTLEGPADTTLSEAQAAPLVMPLDVLGQRNEGLRHRIDALRGRLEDAALLRDEFQQLIQPLSEIAGELEVARTRVIELEQGLRLEKRSHEETDQAMVDLKARQLTYEMNIADLSRKYEAAATEAGERAARLEQVEEALRAAEESAADGARRSSEFEKALKVHEREATSARAALEASTARVAALENDLFLATERLAVLELEALRLQEASTAQSQQLTDTTLQRKTAEADLGDTRKKLAELEATHTRELAAREQAATRQRALLGALQAEKAATEDQNAGLRARLEVSEQSSRQLRQQLLERDEGYRQLERATSEMQVSRSLTDNALKAAQTEATKLAERLNEAEKARRESDSRNAMIAKAIAAKDAIIEQSAERIASLTAALADLEAVLQAEKAGFHVSTQRLSAELENERSERALLQGALNISRESRAEVQRQFDVFRRALRLNPAGGETGQPVAPESNILSINQKG